MTRQKKKQIEIEVQALKHLYFSPLSFSPLSHIHQNHWDQTALIIFIILINILFQCLKTFIQKMRESWVKSD